MSKVRDSLYIIYCFALFASLSFAQQGQFRRPVSNSDARIGEIQNKLLTVQNDIAKLNVEMLEGNNSNALQVRLAALETEFQNLRRQLDDQRREGQNENGKYDVAITQLTNFYNKLDEQMRSLQESIKRKINADGTRRVPEEIIENIKSHQFAEADKKIKEIGSSSPKIRMIVHQIYANNIGNFELLKDYSASSRTIGISYSVLSALWYEMKANGHMDVYKLMPLYETLTTEVINQSQVTDKTKSKAINVRNEVSNSIVNNAAETLKAAIHARNYENNENIRNLAKALYHLDDDVSDKTMRKVIDDVYDVTPKNQLVSNMYDNDMIPQIVAAMVHIFRKFQQKGHVNDPATMMIARNLKRLQGMSYYKSSLASKKKNDAQDVINDLPKAVYALYFGDKVCIKNVKYSDEYIYSPHHRYQWNSDRRYVFTWGGGYLPLEGTWYSKHYEDFTFQFVNVNYADEYMYVTEVAPHSPEYRYVLTWMPGGSIGDKSAWRIDLYGDEVSIRNKHFQELLCVSRKEDSKWRRYVFVNREDRDTNAKECRWKIEACS